MVYDDRKASHMRLPVGLAPSTVWRWLGWLGRMTVPLRAAWELIRHIAISYWSARTSGPILG